MYTIELLQAINDWQSTGMGSNKTQIAERLIKYSKKIPSKFKRIRSKCYRQLALSGENSVKLGLNMELPETYSSWTFDKSVAKSFNGGIPPVGKQGVIFEVDENTPDCEVIINLNELFKDNDFIDACNLHKNNIISYKSGIGYFMNKEAEVVLKIKKITTEQIWAYGGYSSSKEQLAKMFFNREPTNQDLVFFDELVKNNEVNIGGNWVTHLGKDRIVRFHIETAQRLSKKQ